jgi:ABC-type transport system involved in cytochrome c biogenesis permease component
VLQSMTAKVVAEGFDDRSHQLRPTRQARKPRRVHGRALVWKSWRWLSGGWFWFSFRLVGMPLCLAILAYTVAWAVGETLPTWVLACFISTAGIVVFIAAFAILFDRLFAIEIQQKTLDSLLLLPHSRNSMFRQMVLGLLPGILASLSSLICGLILIFATDSRAVQQAQDVLASPWLYYIFEMLISTLYFGVFLSIKLRYGGMLVAIVTLWFVGPMIVSSIFAIVSTVVGPQKINDFGTTALPLLLIVAQVAFCVWLHKRLIQSLEHAGAES